MEAANDDPLVTKTEGEETPVAPTITIHQIQLERFEELVYQHQHAHAGNEFMTILGKHAAGAGFTGYPRSQFAGPLAERLHTRLASAIGALFCDPLFELTIEGYAQVAAYQSTIDTIFAMSIYGTSDHFLPLLSADVMEKDPVKLNYPNEQAFAKSLLLWCINSRIDVDFEKGAASAPDTMFPLWVGILARTVALGERGHARREKLLELGHFFAEQEISGAILQTVSNAYMHCSYAVREDKHQVKKVLSRILKRSFGKKIGAGISIGREITARARRPLGGDEKPVMLFPLEWWTSFHAMYRVYAPVVEQLKPYFKLIAYVREDAIDERSAKLFDEILYVPKDRTIIMAEVVENIRRYKPDVVYYLSSGMAQWWVALSCVRLAPIQMLSLGHPASSMSTEMDYVLVEENMVGNDNKLPGIPPKPIFSETIVELPIDSLQFHRRADEDRTWMDNLNAMRAIQKFNGVRVAIPSMAAKLTQPFIKMLEEVRKEAEALFVKVEYHFFPNLIGMGHGWMLKELTSMVPGCRVHERADYDSYLGTLALSDIHASPYPFGGTNSNLDSLQLGIPILTLEGPYEPHERYDAAMLRRAELPDLIVKTAEEYKATLLKLCIDPEFRDEQRAKVSSADIDEKFYGELKGPARDAYARAILYVYRNHHRIDKKVRWQDYTVIDPNRVY